MVQKMGVPEDENPELTPEALVRHRAATRKIVADFIARGDRPDTRTQREMDEASKKLLSTLGQLGQRIIDAGYTEAEWNQFIENEVEAVRAENAEG